HLQFVSILSMNKRAKKSRDRKDKPNLFGILKDYKGMVILLVILTLIGNGANLVIPKIIGHGIDSFTDGSYLLKTIIIEFLIAGMIIFVFRYLQQIVQTFASEKVAFDLRKKLSDKISRQSFSFIQKSNPSKLLTNLTSDMDSVKMFVSMAVTTIISSLFIIIGASIILFRINSKLALPIIGMIPLISLIFFMIFKRVRILFKKSRKVVDWLNRVINESILGAAIIRVLNSQQNEYRKFLDASAESKKLGISILTLFATLIPVVTFISNLGVLTILALGGRFVINGSLSLGDFAAFNSYVAILIFPIIMIGFMSNIIAQASASYARIDEVLKAPETSDLGTIKSSDLGDIFINNVTVTYDEKPALQSVSFNIKKGSQTAIIGPTAAGKSQLFYLLTGLIKPNSGEILFDGIPLDNYQKEEFHKQIGFVFQDSVLFNMSLRENIAFSDAVSNESLEKALQTAELTDYVNSLPKKLDTMVSERGTSLSGGQKQRIMLARALALNPKILLLDDFTARVDRQTEARILCNVMVNYPELTLISITQKIAPVKHFDQIILLMKGELIASGKHEELYETSPEYIQIYNSQFSTSHYEV
nr:ABC transporter ATP-binding protein [Desulfobacteraceae bacterium]